MSFNHWAMIAHNLKPACQHIITDTTVQIRDNAQANATRRTGFMADAVYSVTPDGNSTYGQASPEGGSYLLEEVVPEDDMTGIVGAAANYSIFVEMGTVRMAAQPFFYPAVETGSKQFEDNMSQFESLLMEGI